MEINYIEDCSEVHVGKVVKANRVTVAAFRNGKYLFVKRRSRNTLELPEMEKLPNETPRDTVRRLLSESLGVLTAKIDFVTAYTCTEGSEVEYGLLYCVYIDELGPFPFSDLISVYYLDTPPEDREQWSFPDIHMPLLDKAIEFQKH